MKDSENINDIIKEALNGDSHALECILLEVKDMVFNLSLRMLGTITDAEDATQDIFIKIMTHLASFRQESQFKTWVYRLSANFLIDYKKSMFAKYPLDFDYYSNDIKAGYDDFTDRLLDTMNRKAFSEELKLSCTNVMLQCFDPTTRCIFILGTMFKVNSTIAGEILGMSPDNYRKKLSRARKKMAAFLSEHCGLTDTGYCRCDKRMEYAVSHHRLNPDQLEYQALKQLDQDLLIDVKNAMEEIDELSLIFEDLPSYQSPLSTKKFLTRLLQSKQMKTMKDY